VVPGVRLAIRCALALSAGACHRVADEAPPCSAVTARFLDLARHDLSQAGVDEATARGVTEQLPAMRDALAQACTEGKWSAAVRTCLVEAGDHAGFESCQRQLSDEQRRDLDRANRGTSAPAR
jgi:hypothetical protein